VMFTFLLSFADPEKEPGTQFLGVCIVDAPTFQDATQKCWDLNINPGGEILAYRLPSTHPFPSESKDRLLTREEAIAADKAAEAADKAAEAALKGDN